MVVSLEGRGHGFQFSFTFHNIWPRAGPLMTIFQKRLLAFQIEIYHYKEFMSMWIMKYKALDKTSVIDLSKINIWIVTISFMGCWLCKQKAGVQRRGTWAQRSLCLTPMGTRTNTRGLVLCTYCRKKTQASHWGPMTTTSGVLPNITAQSFYSIFRNCLMIPKFTSTASLRKGASRCFSWGVSRALIHLKLLLYYQEEKKKNQENQQ